MHPTSLATPTHTINVSINGTAVPGVTAVQGTPTGTPVALAPKPPAPPSRAQKRAFARNVQRHMAVIGARRSKQEPAVLARSKGR